MNSIESIVFDWSGTTQDDRIPVYETNMRLLDFFGKPRMDFEAFLPKTVLTAAEFLRTNGVNESSEYLSKLYKKFLDKVIEEGIKPEVYPDVRSTLQHLHMKNIILGVVSSHPEKILRKEAESYHISDYYSLIKGDSKDKTADLNDICKSLKLKKSSCVYVDDTTWGIMAAKEARVISCGITTGYHTKEMLVNEQPEILIDSLSELKQIV
jgi:phosphoglycolate phosphatase